MTGAAWAAMLEAMWAALPPVGPGDVVLHTAPMSHFGGSVGSAYTLAGAAALPLARFDAGAVLEAAERHAVTAMPMVPTMLERLTAAAVERGARPAALRAIVYGAAPISVPAAAARPGRVRRRAAPVLRAERGAGAADRARARRPRLRRRRAAGVGGPSGRVGAALGPGRGRRAAPAGETGELAVSGPQIMPGYWNDEAASAAALTGGVFRTGDLGFVDAGGYLHLAGRRSEVIVTGGYTVHPGEVERAIAALDGVAEVAVLGVPDATWGETVAAAVVPRPGAAVTEDDVLRACAARLAGYKKPRRIVFADELPQNSTGKVARRLLRAWF